MYIKHRTLQMVHEIEKYNIKKLQDNCLEVNECRGEKTRTSDLHVPNVARCQLCYTPSWLLLRIATAKLIIFSIISNPISVKFNIKTG